MLYDSPEKHFAIMNKISLIYNYIYCVLIFIFYLKHLFIKIILSKVTETSNL